jgi:hypothetical protein
LADNSAIEWTEATWNPVTGCDKVSPGCAHCYAETFAERWRGISGHPYEQGFALKLWPQRLEQPLKWSRPRMIFVGLLPKEPPLAFPATSQVDGELRELRCHYGPVLYRVLYRRSKNLSLFTDFGKIDKTTYKLDHD